MTYLRCVTGLNKEKKKKWMNIYLYIFNYIFINFLHFSFVTVDCVCSLESHQHGGSV